MGVKSESDIIRNSMPEDDPNSNTQNDQREVTPRWGPQHAGAKELASQYTFGKRVQEIICLVLSIGLMIVNFIQLCRYFNPANVHYILICAVLGIVTADFFSGLVHWAADTWGTVELPIVGKDFLEAFRQYQQGEGPRPSPQVIIGVGQNFHTDVEPYANLFFSVTVCHLQASDLLSQYTVSTSRPEMSHSDQYDHHMTALKRTQATIPFTTITQDVIPEPVYQDNLPMM